MDGRGSAAAGPLPVPEGGLGLPEGGRDHPRGPAPRRRVPSRPVPWPGAGDRFPREGGQGPPRGAAPPHGGGGAYGDPGLPRRPYARVRDRGPVPRSPLCAHGGGVGPDAPLRRGRAVRRLPRGRARPRPEALRWRVRGPFHGLPHPHELDAGEGLEADQPGRGPRLRAAVAGAHPPDDEERDPAADRERAPPPRERRGDRGVPPGRAAAEGDARLPQGEVQGGGAREGLHHAVPAVHVQPARRDPEPRERAPHGPLRDRDVPPPHRPLERRDFQGVRGRARLRGGRYSVSDRPHHRDDERHGVLDAGVRDDEVVRDLPRWGPPVPPALDAPPAHVLPPQAEVAQLRWRHVETARWTAVKFPRTAKTAIAHPRTGYWNGSIPSALIEFGS